MQDSYPEGLWNPISSRLNACWQTNWAVEDHANKTWARQPVPMISKHSAHLTPLLLGIRTWLWRYTYLLLLISMLWHRQAIFESKGDKLSSSAVCRILTSRLLDIKWLRLICIKRSIEEVKSAKYLNAVISRGLVMKHYKRHDVNFAMSSSVTELWKVWVSLTMKCTILPKLLLISRTGEASVLFHDFLILFCINDIFVNYILLDKWKWVKISTLFTS